MYCIMYIEYLSGSMYIEIIQYSVLPVYLYYLHF